MTIAINNYRETQFTYTELTKIIEQPRFSSLHTLFIEYELINFDGTDEYSYLSSRI